jgi:L-lactate utilization protein LutB
MVGTETYTVEAPNGESDEVELPEGLVDMLAEEGENPSHVVTDVIVQAFAQQAHVIAHHTEGETPDDVAEIEEKAAEIFEERFGQSLEAAMGHSH